MIQEWEESWLNPYQGEEAGREKIGVYLLQLKVCQPWQGFTTIGRTQIVTALKVCVYCLVFFNAERIQG